MLTSLAQFAIRRRRRVLIATLILAIVAGGFGTSVFGRLTSGGFDDTSSESWHGSEILQKQFDQRSANFVLLVDGKGVAVDSPEVSAKGKALTDSLMHEADVDNVVSYWNTPDSPGLHSTNGRQALIIANLEPSHGSEVDMSKRLSQKYSTNDSVRVTAGGAAEIMRQINKQVESDLGRAELISFPLVLVALVLIFGGVIAASLPLAVGVTSILGTFLILRLLTEIVNVSVFSLNLTTMLGLGLGIDYSLFIITRYREELRKGASIEDAIVRSVQTGGRTVLFSSLVVAVSLSALMVFPLYFLRSFAYAGVSVVLLSAVSSLVFMPALLASLGPRIDRFRIFTPTPPEEGSGFWAGVARTVMRRPVVVLVVTVGALSVFAIPFVHASWGATDDRALPASASSRQVADAIRHDFDGSESAAASVVLPSIDVTTQSGALDKYAAAISAAQGVRRVSGPTGLYVGGNRVSDPLAASSTSQVTTKGAVLRVALGVEPISKEGEHVVRELRALPAPSERLVTGTSAIFVDNKQPILDRAPMAGALIAIATLFILFLMTGSVILPIKAVVLGALSLTAVFGSMIWIFQEGHLSNLLHFTATGSLDITNPMIMFCIAFGLSMDYEVFLLSRIKETYDQTHDTEAAVIAGLGSTGRVVTAAAALIAIVFLAFATSEISFLKLIGLGCAVAVLVDATIVRGVLVPAFMKLMGGANWWAPAPLRRIHERFGLSEATE